MHCPRYFWGFHLLKDIQTDNPKEEGYSGGEKVHLVETKIVAKCNIFADTFEEALANAKKLFPVGIDHCSLYEVTEVSPMQIAQMKAMADIANRTTEGDEWKD